MKKNHGKELLQHYAEEVVRFGGKTSVENIMDSFYFLLINGILSSIAIYAMVLFAKKTGKPVEERIVSMLNKWVSGSVTAAEYFELVRHPETLSHIPFDAPKNKKQCDYDQ